MRKTRIIGVVNLLGDVVVQSVNFKKYLPIGNPRIVIEYLNNWGIDEIVILNITRKKNLLKKIPKFVKNSFVPITAGGGISNLEEIDFLLQNGADKIIINTQAILEPSLIKKASEKYGSQAVMISLDLKKIGNEYVIFINSGSEKVDIKFRDVVKIIEDNGAGELLINSIDRDGSKLGFEKKLAIYTKKITKLPIIFSGGAGTNFHFREMLSLNLSGLCAANFFNFKEQSVRYLKKYLLKHDKKKRLRNSI
tara:strand:+ start:149 stop:901 length:753 start_codon:yes stop_codon:yes gene_type:complete